MSNAYAAVDKQYEHDMEATHEEQEFWQAIEGTIDEIKEAFEKKDIGALDKGAGEIKELIKSHPCGI